MKLRNLLEEFGAVEVFNFIPPRGCAYVTFVKRKHASRAVEKLDGSRVDGKNLKVRRSSLLFVCD